MIHLPTHAFPSDYVLFRVEPPEEAIRRLESRDLPAGWDANPPSPAAQAIGARWVASRSSLVLQVPSIVIRSESNFLINPAHPDSGRLTISKPELFLFDPRDLTGSRRRAR